MIDDTLKQIHSSGIVSVIRELPREKLRRVAQALFAGGVTCVEVALNTPDALAMIADFRREFDGRMFVGAGTVLDLASARAAMHAGAEYLLAPVFVPEVVNFCTKNDLLAVPGCFTPTEALIAYRHGPQLIKLFPAGIPGPGYIKDLLAPLPFLQLMPMGGINLQNAAAFAQAGAFALGVGTCLVDPKAVAAERYGDVTAAAMALRAAFGC